MIPHSFPQAIEDQIDRTLAKPTRIHKIPCKSSSPLWVKREDELSSGISGGKLRKYASLIPYLKKNEINTVGMVGGPNSNNLVGLAQLLRENGIRPVAFVREAADKQLRGNALLLQMLLHETELQFIQRSEWNSVEAIARKSLQTYEERRFHTHLLTEGCFSFQAMIGTLSLAEDILRNEQDVGQTFNRIYMDCGTGLSAIGLILGLEHLLKHALGKREVVVTLIAETESGFAAKLQEMRERLEDTCPQSSDRNITVRFLKPHLSPRFGSINKALFEECVEIARNTGLIMDPTYSVKHYATALRDHAECEHRRETALFVFNGSALGTSGFQDMLARSASSR